MIPATVRAIVFDAVGTLIHPRPSAAEVYHVVARRFGSRMSVEEVRARFASAFSAEEQADRASGFTASAEREQERWRRIVQTVLDDVESPDDCYRVLYAHFARPESWECEPDAEATLAELRRRGYSLAIASNFDSRLRPVVAGRAELRLIETLVISAEVGWRKPASEFFRALALELRCNPREILFVGDDLENDIKGAFAAGLNAVRYDRTSLEPTPGCVRLLGDLVTRGIAPTE
jgi:putative hydrolase of the HAD superfamily